MGDDDKPVDYKVPEKVGIHDLVNRDKDDESLENYKKQLLGNTTDFYSPPDDPRRVVILEMHVIFEDRPGGDIVYKGLDKQETLDVLKKTPFVFKEGCKYKIKVVFRVQHDIVTGLKYQNKVFKTIQVGKEEYMLGSYPPQEQPFEVTFPRYGWDEAPSGMLARGNYKSTSKFVDDDGQCHLKFEYAFSIKKDWGKD